MNLLLINKNYIFLNSFSLSLIGFFIIVFLLIFGRRIRLAIQLERFGLPIAVISGIIGIVIGPYGFFHFLPKSTIETWKDFPTPLLALVFATLMLGRPVPNLKGLIKPIFNQFLLALALGFGQFLVGGLVVKYILSPNMEVNPLMGCLIEVGFEGGHGAALIIGNSFSKLGFNEGLDLCLAMATMGLLASSLIGSIFIFMGRVFNLSDQEDINLTNDQSSSTIQMNLFDDFKNLLVNFGFSGLAITIGIFLLQVIRFASRFFGDFSKEVIYSLPVFPLVLMGSLLIRYVLEKTNKTNFISQILQREIGILSTDLLIFTAMASLDLSIVLENWLPILFLTIFGLIWNILCIGIFAYFVFDEYWFQKGLVEFGNSTGVVASGLLLLRLADPKNISKTLPIFTSKQLFAQLLLSGGFFTVLSPLLLSRIGLEYWTEICAFITFLTVCLAVLINKKSSISFG